jgi:PEP-CTERM motif-containing protein
MIAGEGTLYGFSGTSMYSIDLSDGALTFVRSTPSGLGNFEGGTPVLTSSTPEPSAALLLGTGILGLLGAVRRRINL